MTGWQIFLLVAAIVALLLWAPVRLWVRWDQVLTLRVGYLCFTKTLSLSSKEETDPQKQEKAARKAEKAKAKAAKKAQTAGEQPKVKKSLGENPADTLVQYAGMLPGALRSVGRAGRFLLRQITIKPLILRLVIAKGDAAETGVAYGQANAAIYTAYALLSQVMRLRRVSLGIAPDFLAEESSVYAEGCLRISPAAALGAGFLLVGSLLWQFLTHIKTDKTAQPVGAGAK